MTSYYWWEKSTHELHEQGHLSPEHNKATHIQSFLSSTQGQKKMDKRYCTTIGAWVSYNKIKE